MSAELSDLDLADFEKQTSMAGNKRNSDTAGIDSNETFSPDETGHHTKKPQVKNAPPFFSPSFCPFSGSAWYLVLRALYNIYIFVNT